MLTQAPVPQVSRALNFKMIQEDPLHETAVESLTINQRTYFRFWTSSWLSNALLYVTCQCYIQCSHCFKNGDHRLSAAFCRACETGTLAEVVIPDQATEEGFADKLNGRADALGENEGVPMGGNVFKSANSKT
jgi:hypothetical protein